MSRPQLRRSFARCDLKKIEAIEPCAVLGCVRAKPRGLGITRIKRCLEDPSVVLDELRHRLI